MLKPSSQASHSVPEHEGRKTATARQFPVSLWEGGRLEGQNQLCQMLPFNQAAATLNCLDLDASGGHS